MTTLALKLTTTAPSTETVRHSGLRRRPLAASLELAAVLSLMASSAAYALYTLCHLA